MKTTFKSILALAIGAVAMTFASCSSDEDAVVPAQQEIETKIIGKWKNVSELGIETPTNNRFIETYETGGKGFESSCKVHPETKELGWINKKAFIYTISGSYVVTKDNMKVKPEGAPESMPAPEPMENKQQIMSIDNSSMSVSRLNGELQVNLKKVTADYSQDIIGMWEGVEVTGYETYGNAEHRIEYKADGSYTYYNKVDGYWVPSANVDNEYNVDGDWLATRWRSEAGKDYNYEWWDIDYIKDGTMKWSALREKEDRTRFTTTFTWKKVEMPTQQEIEEKIVGKWKTVVIDGQECPTNNRAVFTFSTDGTYTLSISRYLEDISQSVWFNCETFGYKVDGNVITKEQWDDSNMYTEVYNITDDYFVEHHLKFQSPTMEYALDHVDRQKKVTADYSKDIIGMWEGVEMTGYETYGNAEARIEYRADGTYTYYKKVNGAWQPLEDVFDEYNVDGDWLATRWQNNGSDVMNYEWWDIDYIKDGMMKWSALREKEDGTRFTTTFTWKKVENKG